MENINIVLLLLCFATACIPCYFLAKNTKSNYTESRAFCLGFLLFYAGMFLYGFIAHIVNPEDFASLLRKFAGKETSSAFINSIIAAASFLFIIYNLVIAFITKKGKNELTWVIGLFIAGLIVLSILLAIPTGENPLTLFFGACCCVMAYFAGTLELTYKEFCVLGNIYLQDLIILLFALAPVALLIRKHQFNGKNMLPKTLLLVNAGLHFIATMIVAVHYWMPLEPSFDLCYHELIWLGNATGLGYIGANMITFVIPFVLDLIWNAALYHITAKKIAQ